MQKVRRQALRLAIGVLMTQLCVVAALAVAPAFCCEPAKAQSSGLPDCCKGDGHSCPLKKLAASNDADGSGTKMRGCVSTDERIASLLFGSVGVLVDLEPLPAPAVVASLESGSVYESNRVTPADSPPPRA